MYKVGSDLWKFNTRDLMRATKCSHCTAISVLRSLGVQEVLDRIEPYLVPEKTTAQKYGQIYEDTLTSELIASTPSGTVARPELIESSMAERIAATAELVRSGTPVIYQGALEHRDGLTTFQGMPDFLVHQDWELLFVDGKLTAKKTRPDSGESKYTAWDAKSAKSPKDTHLMQVALYISALDAAGWKAEGGSHGILLGGRRFEAVDELEVVAEMVATRRRLADSIAEFAHLYDSGGVDEYLSNFRWCCTTKTQCDECEYPGLCDFMRHETDDLLLVPGMRGDQATTLMNAGIKTLTDLGESTPSQRPSTMKTETFEALRVQAQAQLKTRMHSAPYFELRAEPTLHELPASTAGDIYFDMEGFSYYDEGEGLEYLFGNWTPEGTFVAFWAHNREQEREAFLRFMEWALDRLRSNPDARVYHYSHYEKSALRKLANRHGVLQSEVAWLESEGKFVDLMKHVNKSLILGQESYSIKVLERYYGYGRSAEVKKATESIDGYDVYLGLQQQAEDESLSAETRQAAKAQADTIISDIEHYNREDVESTMALHLWLLSLIGSGTEASSKPTS